MTPMPNAAAPELDELTITIVVDNATDILSSIGRSPATSGNRVPAHELVVDVHPDRPDQRGILTPLDVFAMLPPEPTLDAIEAAGGRVVTHDEVHEVSDLFLASGDIPRQTSYETGIAGHHTWRDGDATLDPEIHLTGATEDRIEPTVRDLTNLVAPRIVAPGQCTGCRAAAALTNAFGPSGSAPSVVGSRYVLSAS